MNMKINRPVIPAKAGIHKIWIPAFAGMTFLFLAPLLAAPHAFPVPFIAKQHTSITFNELPGPGEIKIFTIAGEEVADLVLQALERTGQR